ncbi:beta strand repeat-containing protein [Oleiharenicola lentus]|nr:autotransporter-associated beta strand repeat-containing protein [Oleiharenicola lentus]
MRPRLLRILLVAGLCLAVGDLLQGQTIVWSGAGNRFVTGSNWVGGVAPGSTNTAQFGNHAGATTIMVNSATINHLEFTATRPATHNFSYDDGTAILTLNGNFTAQGTGSASAINFYLNSFNQVDLALPNGEHLFDIGALTTVTIASVVSGTGHLSKVGAGTLVLTGTNTLNYNGVGGFNNGVAVDGGTLELNGGSITQSSQDIIVGSVPGGTGTLLVSNGGDVTANYGVAGNDSSTNGTITVTGAGSTWTNSQGMALGYLGSGTLNVLAGGTVNTTGSGSDHSYLGLQSGTTGTATVSGTGSAWTTPNDQLIIGGGGTGNLTVSAGGLVTNTSGSVGLNAGGNGTVTVNNGTWTNSAELLVGNSGTGSLAISNGGDVTNTYSYIATQSGSNGSVTVDGAGSTWVNSGLLAVGQGGTGGLSITNGGVVSNTFGEIGYSTGSTGTVLVSGTGSIWTNSNTVNVGNAGTGTLTLASGGVINVNAGAGNINLGASGGSGTLNLGAPAASAAAAGGIANAASITGGTAGTLQFKTTATSGTPYYLTKDGTSGGTAVTVAGSTSVVNTAGYTVLGSANTYTGATTVNGGTLVVTALANGGSSSSIGSSSSAAANLVLNGGTLRYTGGNGSTDRLFTLGVNGGTLDISNATAAGGFTFGNTGSVALTGTNTARTLSLAGTPGYSSTVYFNSQLGDNGTGATSVVALDGSFWRFSAANTYSGGTTVNSGGFLIAINTAGSATGSGNITVNSGGRLGLGSNSPDGAISGNIAVTGTGTVEFNRSTAYTYAGVISGTGSVLHTGTAGNITLTGANTYTGGTTINGTMRIGSGGTTGSIVGNVTNNGTLIFDRSDASAFSGNISGTGSLFKQSAGAITLSGTHTYAGGTTITNGSMNLTGSISHGTTDFLINGNGTAPALNISGGGDLTADRLRLGITSSSFTGLATVDGAGSTLTANTYLYVGEAGQGSLYAINGGSIGSANTSIGNNTGGDGGVFVSGAGSTLSNTSTLYVGSAGTGFVEISGGGLVSNNSASIGNNPGGDGSVYMDTGGTWTTIGNIVIGNAGTGDLSIYGGASASAATATIASLNGVVGILSVNDAGSTFTTSGNLVVGGSGDGILEIANGADVVTGGSNAVLANTTGSTGTLDLRGAGSTWSIAGSSLYLGNNAVGEAYLTASGLLSVGAGSGTVYLANNPGSSGSLYFGIYSGEGGDLAGILNAAAITTPGGTGKVYFQSYGSTSSAPFYLTKDGTVAGAAVTIGGSTSVEHDIGYTVLSGANTYTGGTTISGGTLVMGSNSALGTGSVTLNGGTLSVASGITFGNALNIGVSGGRIGGTGTFSSPLTLGNGVKIAPGNSPGTINFTSGLTLNDGGILEIEIRAPSGTPGTDWDFVNVTGTLNLSGLTTGGYTLKAISLDLLDNQGQPVSGLVGPTSWTIATASTGITGFEAADFVFDLSQFHGGGFFNLSQSGNNLLLNFTPVPEPSTYALMLGGLALAGLQWRRRRAAGRDR